MPIRQDHGGGLLSASATMSAKAQKPHADAAGHPSSGLKLSTGLTEPTLFLALVPCLVPPSTTPPAARLANVPVRPMIQLAVTPVDVAQAWLYARFWHWHWSRASYYWLVNAIGMGIAAVLLPLFVSTFWHHSEIKRSPTPTVGGTPTSLGSGSSPAVESHRCRYDLVYQADTEYQLSRRSRCQDSVARIPTQYQMIFNARCRAGARG